MIVGRTQPCPHCGLIHLGGVCLRVKAIEYFPNGMVKRVEYCQPVTDWPLVETDMEDWKAWAKEGDK